MYYVARAHGREFAAESMRKICSYFDLLRIQMPFDMLIEELPLQVGLIVSFCD
jgi:hypothetical protein